MIGYFDKGMQIPNREIGLVSSIFNEVTSLKELNPEGGKKMAKKDQKLEEVGIGTKEIKRLTATDVVIQSARVEAAGEKGAKKVVCEVMHPDSEKPIKISSAKIERNGNLEISGLWYNTDEDELIRKNSTLALFLNFMKVGTVKALEGRTCATIEDASGYLVFKGY